MKFIDVAEIKVKAGTGGVAMVHFRREKYVPLGGPDGGNGGNGGSIYVQGDEGLSTLLDFRYQRNHEAKDGDKGGTNNRVGRCAEDLILKAPCGTAISDAETGELIGEVLQHGDKVLVAKGGNGGVGNALFASSRNQAPTKSIPPQTGEVRTISLELKIMADVGIIGAPNAGKSTLVTVISAARPKVADYPFTTITPSLGVVSHKDANPFVVADVPGLIPGASEGKGLGHEFLRHIERCRILLHLIDGSQASAEGMIKDYEGILTELDLYKPELLARPRMTIITKLDAIDIDQETGMPNSLLKFRKYLENAGVKYLEISCAERTGITDVLDKVIQLLNEETSND